MQASEWLPAFFIFVDIRVTENNYMKIKLLPSAV
jgi:hypothetical protein